MMTVASMQTSPAPATSSTLAGSASISATTANTIAPASLSMAKTPAMLADPKLASKPVKQYTLVLCLDRSSASNLHTQPQSQAQAHRILLGYKKAGFGAHKFNGFGGKVERSDSSVRAAAARELHEESGIWVPESMLLRAGTLVFDFEDGGSAPPFILHVSVFTLDWKPEVILPLDENASAPVPPPFETDEMIPQWFDVHAIPFADMWPDDELWFPAMLADKPFVGQMWFAADQKTILKSIVAKDDSGEDWDQFFVARKLEQEARGVFV
ncbi:hypothetical protein BCR44DRAFT_1432353 [Catenaria anguillulae PL171]|uniref:Nudix hydrolase domain-containing protein n=1 Tax=Catenaria anguillulae PL171 TaxID=765915 RepID=A0A1Y2HU38_9FUNG|nr:hypothetical protein BCR44DRAFT_1432353 [Catenaria anguillulae PL171]